jgi:predicted nucleotidyltransferase component of viral defense system
MNEIHENDILANKLMAMTDRLDPKDYVDVYFILQDNKCNIRRD